ncbi:cytochrome c oxidase assembly factor Coa1 family protein [Prosthecobacter vanneervenii]|uniref:Cytochrome oxidase complex assembly protein 1 n=1 Tax=Prosthecobacter vanneervenii TaxID=48466 RepID=A0A7W8DJX9_9BACT|nr:cytochrome c oxidase assembly factor Coa1 family protein [Prosthecobacter vanneervenii]MBB5032644.1 hypothetical protein [Prosthecobacter vanneervenii]
MDSLPHPPPPPSPFPAPPPALTPAGKASGGKWVLLGCGGCLGLILVSVVISFGVYFLAMGFIQKSDVYTEALKRVENSSEVRKELGTPMAPGWSFSGSANYNNGVGNADFTLPVRGPKAEGTLRVKAHKASKAAAWEYSTLEVELPDGKKLDLRTGP